MLLSSADACNILHNLVSQTTDVGKSLLGKTWDNFTPEEKYAFGETMSLLSKARIAELAGNEAFKPIADTLKVSMGEWKLAGKTEVLSVIHQVAMALLGIGLSAVSTALKDVVLGAL